MKIVIDFREKTLFQLLNSEIENSKSLFKKEIIVESGNLPLGDIVIYDDQMKELIILERKS